MVAATKKVVPNVIVIEMSEYEAEELANYLDKTDMHLGVGDRMRIARVIKQALKK
jgi:PHD/YefM family antitoxin component YafN of YafNO toxin-antitoxin module